MFFACVQFKCSLWAKKKKKIEALFSYNNISQSILSHKKMVLFYYRKKWNIENLVLKENKKEIIIVPQVCWGEFLAE